MKDPALPAATAATADQRKLAEALQRAIPVTRMVDYGVPTGDAIEVHAQTGSEALTPWDAACEALALHHMRAATDAERLGRSLTASQAWRAASALGQCGQLAFNADSPHKKRLYEQAHQALAGHALHTGDLEAFTCPTPQGDLHGWRVRPASLPARAAVIVIGGLSGWGGAYLDLGRALAARGMLAILAEGPGQGLTRLRGGMPLRPDTLPLFQAFLTQARAQSATRIGVWGNSFGGLLAAHLAAADAQVQAVCINGAPMAPTVPGFRTAREQMHAVFGTSTEVALADRLTGLALDPRRARIAGAMLVLEGGRDPMVPLGEQAAFLALAERDRGQLLTWPDGEHTLYNHAAERNALVADWFAQQLGATQA